MGQCGSLCSQSNRRIYAEYDCFKIGGLMTTGLVWVMKMLDKKKEDGLGGGGWGSGRCAS